MYENLTEKISKILEKEKEWKDERKKNAALDFIVRWKESWRMRDDVILEACKMAREKNAGMPYINGILRSWHGKGVRSLSDVLRERQDFSGQGKKTSGGYGTKEKRLKVKIKKLSENAKTPTYGSKRAAGADLYNTGYDRTIRSGETLMLGTGLSMEIPDGYMGLIFARSGMACKRNLAPANKVGVIDSDYRGEIKVALHNHGDRMETVEAGERIAQIVFLPVEQADFEVSEILSETERGEGGFGSTGRV